jgi:hypothetical protein
MQEGVLVYEEGFWSSITGQSTDPNSAKEIRNAVAGQ